MVVALALMLTAGVTLGCTVMVKLFDVALVGEAQLSEEVSIQLTTSPLARPLLL
jgi:hypothetical protein